MKKRWIVGTRGSKLALTQTNIVIGALRALYPSFEFETRTIKTTGDSVWDTPLYLIGEKGLFIKEIEDALVRSEVDLAVHSMKDLPTDLAPGLSIAAMLPREDPRDSFISLTHDRLEDVPRGARIGTSSMRRKAQLLASRPDLEIVPLRGNVDTRLKKLETQELDGIVLACAGVRRMGLEGRVKEILPFDLMVPPSGQGAIGIETRTEGDATKLVAPLNHEATRFEVGLERAFQVGVGGGCSVPLGVNARLSDDRVTIRVVFGNDDGTIIFGESAGGAKDEGERLVARLLEGLNRARGV